MSGRVLLVSANRCTIPDPVFPLGLAHLSGALRRAGHEVRWVDCLSDPDRLEEILEEWRPDFVGISLRNIDDIMIRKQERFFDDLALLSDRVRRSSNSRLILGGSGFSIFPERLFELAGADFGIRGEGESALVALIAALQSGGDWSGIPGLVFRRNGNFVTNPPAPRPFDDELGAADRPPVVAAHYVQTSGVLNLQTQRGCAFGCCYCTYPVIEGAHHRRRPPETVAAEFEQLQRLGARYVFIVDSVFNSSPRHVTEVCEAIIRRGLKLPWGCFLRPQGLTTELMGLMKRAGLAHVEFGSDSFCDEVLEAYGKGFVFDDIELSSELARQQEIDFCHFLICGGPGESARTLQEGFENSLRLTGAVILAMVGLRIYPGTPLFARAVAEGVIQRGADLLAPAYYLAPGMTAEATFAQLQEFARLSPSWIVGDPPSAYSRLIEHLRRRGIMGPLWSYFTVIQRLWPQGIPERGPREPGRAPGLERASESVALAVGPRR